MRQPPGKKICFGRRTGFKGERGEVGVTQVERLGAKTGGKNKNDSRGKKIRVFPFCHYCFSPFGLEFPYAFITQNSCFEFVSTL